MAPWTPEDVLENMPTGNAGLGGVTVEWLRGFPIADLQRLADLLTAADEGRRPKIWNYASVTTLSPKGPDSDPQRPQADNGHELHLLSLGGSAREAPQQVDAVMEA